MGHLVPRLPLEFADLLSRRGLSLLAGRDPLSGSLLDPPTRFVSARDLIDRRQAARVLAVLERSLRPVLKEMALPIPPQTITEMTANYSEWLPKTGRVQTAYLDRRSSASYRVAEEVGLAALLRSSSFRAFAAALSGRPLRAKHGMQVLCYGPGDYAGPHNDHHPEDREARAGYLDVHLSLCPDGVRAQELVYSKRGHFTECIDVVTLGGITAYRLPFWHYVTPLRAKRGHQADARRWVLLGTFLYAGDRPSAALKRGGVSELDRARE